MLPINESGENITIENVFHSLNTRLNSMMTGNLDSDYGYSYKESIIEIRNKIFAFPPAIGITQINYSLELIIRVQELIVSLIENINLIENNSIQIDDSWSNTIRENEKNQFEKIYEEITHYKLSLENIQEELFLKLNSTEVNIVPNAGKIKINISIDQFAGLIYFLQKNNIFNIKHKPLCKAIVKLFSLQNGEDISPDSLYNKGYDSVSDGDIVNFWRNKFNEYIRDSYILPKRKK